MQKKFISTSTHIFDPANPSTPPIRQSPPPEPQQSAATGDDKRSLFDKLAEVKAKKEEAFQEAHKFGNLIKRLDDRESDFLANLQQERNREEEEKRRAENEQVDAFKKSFPYSILAQGAIEVVRPSAGEIIPPPPPRRTSSGSRSAAISGILVKRKSESQAGSNKRRRSSATDSSLIDGSAVISPSPTLAKEASESKTAATASSPQSTPSTSKNGASSGILPGLEGYSDSDEDL